VGVGIHGLGVDMRVEWIGVGFRWGVLVELRHGSHFLDIWNLGRLMADGRWRVGIWSVYCLGGATDTNFLPTYYK
jgi:hypothetical protein